MSRTLFSLTFSDSIGFQRHSATAVDSSIEASFQNMLKTKYIDDKVHSYHSEEIVFYFMFLLFWQSASIIKKFNVIYKDQLCIFLA